MKYFISTKLRSMRYPKIREIFDRVKKFDNVINLGIGDPDFHTDTHIIDMAFEEVKKKHYTHYTSTPGFIELREALAKQISDNDRIAVKTEEVIITPGAQNALTNVLFTLLDPGDEVLVPDPYYPSYISQIALTGAKPIFVPTFEKNNFKLDDKEIERRITNKTKLIIINSPNNPTGAVLEREDLEKIARVISKRNLMVISDEAYKDMVFNDINYLSIANLSGMRERTVIVRSFSKSYAMTGWRVGYAVASEEIINNMAKFSGYTLSCPPAISQRAALAALKSSKDIILEMRDEYRKRRDFTVKSLNSIHGVSCILPKGTFYVFPNIKLTGKTSEKIYDELLVKSKVAVIPGSAFGTQGEGYLRIACTVSIEKLQEAMKRIKIFFKQI